ncbi:PREDICTED: uncharacterized protein LOC105975513 [Erythranthe guttata]|uniref:uncharacterized protein LOC105975513 n=1 Tax=Erythranthe guttata TaxID=4155 RepID=UPI00064DA680|nr:PREDICTED: uncharacterized protein LOC105975513 [Erythranthe guttata]|eukprot:XP_012856163.1 PREDICTED: uncharacterized protein LOC105975513 [Erythranthe guttata]
MFRVSGFRAFRVSGSVLLKPYSGAEIRANIGDFGLAKTERSSKKRKTLEPYWRGTPMYLSPEAMIDKVQEGARGQLPKVPNEISKEANDFLKGSFVRWSVFIHTSEMLLHHPFVEVFENDDAVEESVEVEFSCKVYSDEDSFSSWYEEELDEIGET